MTPAAATAPAAASPIPTTKPGRNGPLYLYAIEYKDTGHNAPTMPTPWKAWAYGPDHALEKFWDLGAGQDGFEPVRLAVVPAGNNMRQAQWRTL